MNPQNRKLKEASSIIDNLYQNKWFTDLSRDKRVEKINEVLFGDNSANEIPTFNKGEWSEEKRKDSPHHHTNRLD